MIRLENETTKAQDRRTREKFFDFYVRPPVIDVGAQDNPLPYPGVIAFDCMYQSGRHGDKIGGDATHMHGIEDQSYGTVYASHILEDLREPLVGLRNWYRILRPGGFLIILVPHRELYEKRRLLPSKYNGAHVSMWLPDRTDPPCTFSLIHVIREACPTIETLKLHVQDEGNTIRDPDQHSNGEFTIEYVGRKPA